MVESYLLLLLLDAFGKIKLTNFYGGTTFTVAHLLRLSEIGHQPDIKMVILLDVTTVLLLYSRSAEGIKLKIAKLLDWL